MTVKAKIEQQASALMEQYETLTECEALSIAVQIQQIETQRLCFGVNGEFGENNPTFLENISMSMDSVNTTLLELLYKDESVEITENVEREIFSKQ
jgi:hypothetical protein